MKQKLQEAHHFRCCPGIITGWSNLRAVLAKLETKQQALIFGHAVPMPVVVKVKEYGSTDSYKRYSQPRGEKEAKDVDDLWG